MEKSSKKILGVALLCAGAFIVFKGLKKVNSLINFVKYLTVTPKIDGGLNRIKYYNSALHIPVAVEFGNHSDQEINIGVTSLIIYYNNNTVGRLTPNAQKVIVKKYSNSTLSNLIVDVSIWNLMKFAGSAVTDLITEGNFNSIVNKLTVDVACLLNDKYAFNLNLKFGDTENVNTSNGTVVSGLGLVAKNERRLKPFKDYEHLIPSKSELKNRDLIVIPNGSVDDTVYLMKDVAVKYAKDTETLARYLKKDTLKDTLQSIFDFVYNYIQYVPDSKVQEQVRRPLRTLWDRKGDCDCYATLIGSILTNLGISYKFRIAEYDNKGYYQHVYVIVPTYNGEYYVCDPVLDTCFDEKTPSKYKDF